jgi:hypothetical protein
MFKFAGSHCLVGGRDDLELEYLKHLPSLVRNSAHTRIISCLQTASLMTGYCSVFTIRWLPSTSLGKLLLYFDIRLSTIILTPLLFNGPTQCGVTCLPIEKGWTTRSSPRVYVDMMVYSISWRVSVNSDTAA